MRSLMYKIRLLLAGILFSMSLGVVAQMTSPPVSPDPTFNTLTVTDLSALRVSTVAPRLTFDETDAAANSGLWRISSSAGTFRLDARNDLDDAGTLAFAINRTGTSIDNITFAAQAEFNGSGTDTTSSVLASSGVPTIRWTETDAAANEAQWLVFANSGSLNFETRTDAGAAGSTFISVNRTGTAVDSINLLATDIQHNSIDLTAASGSFVADTIGCSTEITGITISYERIGNLVHATIQEPSPLTCTSDSTSFTIDASVNAPSWWTGIASETGFNPLGGRLVNNGSGLTTLCAQVFASGDISLSDCSGSASWTGSGAKGFDIGFNYSFTFTLN